ncbi:MAG: antitoxin MazE-like protein [Gammaproteobacteria bacterium]
MPNRRDSRFEPQLVTRYAEGKLMTLAAERMRVMRERRRARGLRELRLFVPDARSKQVRRRIARQVAALDRAGERDAMRWIEAVSEFDTQ